jgi:two-component system response regulator HupR/HoxA
MAEGLTSVNGTKGGMESMSLRARVVIVDDDADVMASFVSEFSDEFDVVGFTAPEEAMARLDDRVVVAVVDERMPQISGIEVLSRLQATSPNIIRILLTAYADFDRLAAAINTAGIFRFVSKPWRDDELRQILHQAAELHRLREENRRLMSRLQQERDTLASQKQFLIRHDAHGFGALVGKSDKLKAVVTQARRAVDSSIRVLIEGETGTGKEILAQAIHYESSRRDHLFAPINCAAIPETLLESELFGYRRGAFSGATADKKGLLEIADRGTVFLDEIGEMPLALQAHLLRFLESGEFRPLGDTRVRRVDVRVIAATNRNLRAEVAGGRWREDLYYRVSAFRLTLPPLRDRAEDIPLLARHFLQHVTLKAGKTIRSIADDALRMLCRYRFPGNVRELANEVERAVILADGDSLESEHFSDMITNVDAASENRQNDESPLKARMREFERSQISDALARAGGNRSHTAHTLGISYRWLVQRMHDLDLR